MPPVGQDVHRLLRHVQYQLQLRLRQPKKKEKPRTSIFNPGALSQTVRMECDVRGMELPEALSAVDKYLDQARMAGLGEVTIIHGKGTGTLRAGIQQELRRHQAVKSFRRGVYGEGEDGVTVVQLK